MAKVTPTIQELDAKTQPATSTTAGLVKSSQTIAAGVATM